MTVPAACAKGFRGLSLAAKDDCGISLSLHRRQVLMGWLSGAKYLKTEGWPKLYIEKKDGKWAPTDYAREFNSAALCAVEWIGAG